MNGLRCLISLGLAFMLLAGGAALALPRNPGKVNLSISGAGISLEPPHAGPARLNDQIYINATISNIGDEPAYNVSVVFSYNTTDMPLFQIGTLDLNSSGIVIGATASAVARWVWNTSLLDLTPDTNYSVFVLVRSSNESANQTDDDQSNNFAFANLSFLPDVVPYVEDITSSADNAVVGETVSLLATLGNTGIRPALAEPVGFYLDSEPMPFCQTSIDIPTAGSTAVPCEWNTSGATDGKHNITARVRESARSVMVSLKYTTNPYIAALTASSYVARVGDILAINVTLDNNGLEPALDVSVDFYLDARGNPPLGSLTAGEVPVGTPTRLSFPWDTAGTETGNHTIKARIAGTAKEMRTANITLDEELFPDLAITDVTLSDAAPLVGTVLNISVNISNVGPGAPRANTTLQVLLDSVETVLEMVIAPIAPGSYLNTSFDWDTRAVTPVKHTLRVQVNAYGDFAELNDSNNDRLLQLSFRGSLDLSVRGITFSRSLNQSNPTSEVTVGASLWIWVNVANRGSLSNAANTTLALTLDGSATAFKTYQLPPIAPGRNFTSQFSWDTSAFNDTTTTNHTVRAQVDPQRINNDSDWGNNALSVNLTVHPATPEADLVVASVRAAKATVRYEEVLMLVATISNQGGKPARNFTVRFTYQAGAYPQLIGDQTVAAVLPGESRNVTQGWTVIVAEGNYTVNAIIDPQNSVLETTKSNNAGSTVVSVLPAEERKPDVRLSAPAISPREPRKGAAVNISVTLTNQGNEAASGIVLTLFVGGAPAGKLNVSDLLPGANRTVTMAWNASSGGRDIMFRVNGTNFSESESAAVRVDVAETAQQAGSSLPILIVIVLLIVAAVAVIALGGRKRETREEE